MREIEQLDRMERKAIIKEAITEWLDQKFLELGIWTFRGLMAMAFGVLVYLVLTTNGWVQHK